MDPRAFCTSTRVLIVAGKGGVGKTTVSAVIAKMASDAGLRTLLVEIERRSGLDGLFGRTSLLGYHETVLVPAGPGPGVGEVRGRTLTPDDALIEYLDDHGMRRISRRLSRTGVVDVVATAVPGIKDILVLGKVKQLERGGRGEKLDPEEWGRPADLIVVDAPAAGHTVTFLQSAKGLLDAVRVGPIRNQAQDVADLLGDPTRTGVMLVTLAEETPVNELIETAYALEDRVGVRLTPVVVNALYPPLDGLEVDPVEAAPRKEPTSIPTSSDRSGRPPPSGANARSCRPRRWPGWPRPCRCPSCTCRTCSRTGWGHRSSTSSSRRSLVRS